MVTFTTEIFFKFNKTAPFFKNVCGFNDAFSVPTRRTDDDVTIHSDTQSTMYWTLQHSPAFQRHYLSYNYHNQIYPKVRHFSLYPMT